MSRDSFHVKPVASYDEARYFAAPVNEREEEQHVEKLHPLTMLVLVLLVAGISIGLIGCYMRSDFVPETQPLDSGPDGDPPPPPDCENGQIICVDDATMAACESEEWQERNCDEYCDEVYGIDSFSNGCDASSEEPCQCEYDIVDGDYDPCYPNNLYCVDDDTLFICDDEWREVECTEYCVITHGEGYVPGGTCDPSAEDPCGCHYDMLDGAAPYCEPGDVICVDSETVEICDETGTPITRTCSEHCLETFGVDYFPTGCSDDAENPCGCEYGITDGDPVECSPSDIECIDDDTLRTCEDGVLTLIDCDEECSAREDTDISAGCDASAEDPCQCGNAELK